MESSIESMANGSVIPCLSFLRLRFSGRLYEKGRILLSFYLLLLLILFFLLTGATSVRTAVPVYKSVLTVCIEPGDSLWSIAKEYYTPECGSFKEYLKEIKYCNRLEEDTIHAGRFLIVPHYLSEHPYSDREP